MIIKKWRDNFDTWSYTHWIGTAYLASTVGPMAAACFAVSWELFDMAWHFAGYFISGRWPWNYIAFRVNQVFDQRGLSYGDLIVDGLGILTWYCQVNVGWYVALGVGLIVVVIIETSRKG